MERLVFTVAEAGQLLGIGRNSAYEAVRRGDIRAVRIGKRWVVPKGEIRRILGEAFPVAGGSANGAVDGS
jgi:excisionase family DNA binding protein